VLAGAAALAWPVLKGGVETRPGPTARAASYAFVGLSWLLLAAAVLLDVPRLAGIGGLLLLAAAPLGLGGWPLLRALLPALVYLLLVIPPPFGLDRLLITKLQLLTAKASSRVLDYFGVYHNMDGTVVETAGKRYMVEEACSGIHSLFSILACT